MAKRPKYSKRARARAAKVLGDPMTSPKEKAEAGLILKDESAASAGGRARALRLSPERRREIARKAAQASVKAQKRKWELYRRIKQAEDEAQEKVRQKVLHELDKSRSDEVF